MRKIDSIFNTEKFDDHPISTLIYDIVTDDKGNFADYRIVYGNRTFANDYRRYYSRDDYLGAYIIKNHLMDDYTLQMMENFRTETPHSFSTFVPHLNIYIYVDPIPDLPEGYGGFFVTHITDFDAQESRIHFLKVMRQMNNNACLLHRQEDGRLEAIYVTPAFREMMECETYEDAMNWMDGDGFFNSTHPDDRALVYDMIKNRVSAEGTADLTVRKMTIRNRPIWCTVHYAFIDDFNEHYVYCTYTDVTVLKSYEDQLRSIYNTLGQEFYQATEQTLVQIRVNLTKNIIEETGGEDIYPKYSVGLPYSNATENRITFLPIPAEKKRFLEAFDISALTAAYTNGRVSTDEILYTIRPNGECCYVKFVATVTRHPLTNDMIAFITEQECNDEKVNDTLNDKILARQFDLVAFLANDRYGVTIGDSSLIKHGNIFPRKKNGVYNEYLRDQILPVLNGDDEYKDKIHRAMSLEAVKENLKVREPYIVDIEVLIDGEMYHKRFDFYSADPDAEFYIVLKSDTTELHREQEARNEQLRVALEEANQANVAKTAFLSNMSHEIRTPMNAIIGLNSLAQKDETLSSETREYLEKIGGSAKHLLGLINDILDMSRIESGRLVLRNEEFSFSSMLEQINTMVHSQCSEKGLAFECRIPGTIGERYLGDDMKLKQVLINILSNAIKFTNAPGNVTFTVERIATFEDQSTLRFTVTDTGIGMDKEFIPKMFDAFTQEDSTRGNKFGSTGLGMTITKNIVEMMNGTIDVTSEKGVGSEFVVTVTLKNGSEGTNRMSAIRPQDMRILVVDDDPIACEHATLVLEEKGIRADSCMNGEDALRMLEVQHTKLEPYNLVLLDWKMPEQDGIEVTKEIRRRYSYETTIIILTAYNWDDIVDEALQAGVDSFLSKPVFAESVIEEFERIVRKKNVSLGNNKERADLTGRHILMAEDILINAEIMKQLLTMKEVELDHAENGKIAVDMFKASAEGYYDAILMDMRMPEMDGLEATKRIRSLDREDAETIPIIALTANAFDEDVQRSMQAGLDAHLSKPVEPEALFETLETLIKP